MSVDPDGAYEALLVSHQELEAQVEKLTKEVEWFQKERARLLHCLKDGELLLKELDVAPSEWGLARALFRELAAWIEEE